MVTRVNMTNSSVSKLFKATRRTIVAELTLMIVIVISFSWSAYALYKLFAGGSESLFGYTFANTFQTTQVEPKVNGSASSGISLKQLVSNENDAHSRTIDQRTQAATIQTDQNDLEQQLANYKSQILNELLTRQRRLLGESRSDGQDLLSLLRSGRLNLRDSNQHDNHKPPVVMNELQQWKGGYSMPTSLNYLFENGKSRRSVSTTSVNHQTDHNPFRSDRNYSPAAIKSQPEIARRKSLIHLTDAPSLMQLRPISPSTTSADNIQRVATTPRPSLDASSDDSSHTNNSPDDDQVTTTTATTITTTTIAPPQSADETTTVEPTVHSDEQEDAQNDNPSPNEDSDGDEGGQQEGGNEDGDENESESSDRAADEPMERLRNTSRSIDEDVDRMTQPSLGMASRQDKPPADYRSTVQFDDGPSRLSVSIGDILMNNLKTPAAKAATSHDQATVTPPPSKDRRVAGDNAHAQKSSGDLLVADNDLNRAPISTTTKLDQRSLGLDSPHQDNISAPLRRDDIGAEVRPARSSARKDRLKAGTDSNSRINLRRSKRSSGSTNGSPIDEHGPGRVPKVLKAHRRSDDDGNDDDDDDEEEGENTDQEAQDHQGDSQDLGDDSHAGSATNSQSPSLQELLAHKQLLDALQQSQIPSPISGQQQNGGSNRSLSYEISGSPSRDANQDHDNQSAGTQYSVDHGLLLYPASDEEHEHKSMSHKSGKASKKKGKKKNTMAVKKGGHKNKKHKKEEKKYIKEKKFKGAKKGKKMSKGKGGKGGKKGKKFYKDKGFKKKGFKNIYVKNEFGQKKSYFDEFRDKDFKKKWKNFDDKYNYAQMKKWQAKDVKGAKKMKDQGEHHKKYDKGKWKKDYQKHMESEFAKKKKKSSYDF